jgi:hypothetical protein
MFTDVFIAYSRRDAAWALRLRVYLTPLPDHIRVHFRDDVDTGKESDWLTKLASAKVCVLLVSADFLASGMMAVLPVMLSIGSLKGQTVLCVPVRHAPVEETALRDYQAAIDPRRPLETLTPDELEGALRRIAQFIKSRFPEPAAEPAPAPAAETAETAGEAAHTFVCYAREDSAFVLELAAELKAKGANLWLDRWDIPGSADWDYEIDKALYGCGCFLIVLSRAAVESEEVRSELRIALDEDKRILPVLYQQCRVPRRLKLIQHVDFTAEGPGRDAALEEILSALGR